MLENRIFNDDKISLLSPSEFRLYIYLLSIAADLNTDSFHFNVRLTPSYFRLKVQSTTDLLLSLESFQLLSLEKSAPNTIEKKRIEVEVNGCESKEVVSIVTKKENPVVEKSSNESKFKNHWFRKFIVDVMGSLDTGLDLITPKVEQAFVTEDGFAEFAHSVTSSQKFKDADRDGKIRYFKSALASEMKLRGVLK